MTIFKTIFVAILPTLLLLCNAAGCKSDTTQPVSQPASALAANAGQHVDAADKKLEQAIPLIPTTNPARQLNMDARTDLAAAKGDIGGTVTAAKAEEAHNVADDAQIAKLKADDPLRTKLFWIAGILGLLAVGVGVAAIWFKSLPIIGPNLGYTAAFLAFCAVAAGVIGEVASTLETILIYGFIAVVVAGVIALIYFGIKWYKAHVATLAAKAQTAAAQAQAETAKAQTVAVIKSVEAAKDAGMTVLPSAAAAMDLVQAPVAGLKTLVNTVQAGLTP
jgi:hypothetical protein